MFALAHKIGVPTENSNLCHLPSMSKNVSQFYIFRPIRILNTSRTGVMTTTNHGCGPCAIFPLSRTFGQETHSIGTTTPPKTPQLTKSKYKAKTVPQWLSNYENGIDSGVADTLNEI